MAATRSGSLTAGGDRVGGTSRISFQAALPLNHAGTQNVDTAQRLAERARVVRAAMNHSARQLLIDLHHTQRTESETQKLKDMARDRCAVNDENLAFVMVLQDRVAGHYLSDNLRGVEVRGRADLARECIYDVSELEQALDAEADAIQLKLAREKSPARLMSLREIAPHMAAIWRRLGDIAHYQLSRVS